MIKFTIFKRLVTGFLVILVVVVALGAYAALKFRELNQIIHSISSVDSETIRVTDYLRDSLFTQRKFEKKYVVSEDKDFFRQFIEIKKSIQKELGQLNIFAGSTENAERIVIIKKLYAQYILKVQEEADLINLKKEYSQKDFENSKEALIDELINQLDMLKKITEEAVNNKISMSKRIGSQALRVILVLSIISVILSILIALYNAQTIHRPILLLIRETKEIARGRFTKHLNISSPPEINELAMAFNHMCNRLKELDEMKAELVARVSHEFRTPLAVIREAVSLFMDSIDTASKEKQHKLFGIVQEECERLITSVNKVLNLAQMDAGIIDCHIEKYNLSQLIAICITKIRPIAIRKRISLEENIASNSLYAAIDADKIGQVFDNILGNALKFTPENGKISISVRRRQGNGERYSEDSSKEVIEVSISDTGPGIPEKNIHDIFDKFKKLHEGGTGLGLYIARQIINAHGGDIWVESNGKTGSTFFFTVSAS